MQYRNSSKFIHRETRSAHSLVGRVWLLLLIAVMAAPLVAGAQSDEGGEQTKTSTVVVAAPRRSLQKLLPDKLAGVKATGDVKQYAEDNLGEVVGDKAAIYREYHVRQVASRQY